MNKQIETILLQDPKIKFVKIGGDGQHFEITVVSDVFKDLSKLSRQKWVYTKLASLISSGTVHAVQLYTWTVAEWGNKNG
jgi:acid stress-induced BolA-like protein IbaG/YrbA